MKKSEDVEILLILKTKKLLDFVIWIFVFPCFRDNFCLLLTTLGVFLIQLF